jgi:hypothetical protein
MTVMMAPFTPYFSEYLYQHLKQLFPSKEQFFSENQQLLLLSESEKQTIFGYADSVHYLLLPQVDLSFQNPLAVSRFTILQQAVTLARMAREKRRIRNNLPLKNVIVVFANQIDYDALQYLQTYFRRRSMNLLMPISIIGACFFVVPLWSDAMLLGAQSHEVVTHTILATLLSLAILEHILLVLPLQVEFLWKWGFRQEG